jgi:hypothetical protein
MATLRFHIAFRRKGDLCWCPQREAEMLEQAGGPLDIFIGDKKRIVL